MKPAFYIRDERICVSPVPLKPARVVRGWVWVVFVLLLALIAGSLDAWAEPAPQINQRENQ